MDNIHSTTTEEREKDPSGPAPACTPPPAIAVAAEETLEALPPRLAALTLGIEPHDLGEFVRGLFAGVLRLLGHVESVGSVVESGGALDWVTRVFEALKKTASYLLTNIETAELRVEHLSGEVAETLEAAGFALRHELRRVFEHELNLEAGGESDRLNVLRACALLENCLQQLTVGLARAFDAGVTGAELFENYRQRREDSLALRDELRALLARLRAVEREYSVLSSLALLNQMRRFRYERLHHLMYRDWEDFERFADSLELCYESGEETAGLLNRLSCYLEALLSQVEMRTVLTEA